MFKFSRIDLRVSIKQSFSIINLHFHRYANAHAGGADGNRRAAKSSNAGLLRHRGIAVSLAADLANYAP